MIKTPLMISFNRNHISNDKMAAIMRKRQSSLINIRSLENHTETKDAPSSVFSFQISIKIGQGRPSKDGHFFSHLEFFSSINEKWWLVWSFACRYFFPIPQIFEGIRCNCLPRLNFDGNYFAALLQQTINFMSGFIPPKIEIRWQSSIFSVLENFAHHKCFKNISAERMSNKLFGIFNS